MLDAFLKYLSGESTQLPTLLGGSTAIKTVMLGPRRAGKTTILAVMHERFTNVAGSSALELVVPDDTTQKILDSRVAELARMIPTSWPGEIGPGIAGTLERSEFRFLLKHRFSPTVSGDMQVIFVDSPGGWIESDTDMQVANDLRDADAVIVAIDAPYLMESNGEYHSGRNLPARVTELIMSAFVDQTRRKLLLLVPIRCEPYVTSPQRAAKLVGAVEHGYSQLVGDLVSLPPGCIKSVITPVQTTGCLVFKRWDKADVAPYVAPVFTSRIPQPRYAPVDSDQPLRHLLFFLLEEHLAQRNDGLAGVCRRVLNLNRDLVRSAREFAEGCHYHAGFKVLTP